MATFAGNVIRSATSASRTTADMTLYWLILASLLATVIGGVHGVHHARRAGSTWWLRFHTRLALGASVAAMLFAMIGAPIALKL